ncbi:unnamed protein product [Laminaria digitata]
MLWLRAFGGFFSGVLCSGVMSQSGPCPRSSSCVQCGALPGSRYFSEISRGKAKGDVDYDGRGGSSSSGASSVAAGLARADVRWHVGVVLGLLVGGLSYGRGLGWGWLAHRPAFVACAAASSCALIAAAAWWGWGRKGGGAGGAPTGGGWGGSGGCAWSFRRSRKLSDVDYARPGGQEEAEEDGDGDEAEMPLLGDVSVHSPGLVSVELSPGKARDVEAGDGPGCEVDGPVSSRYLTACKGDAAAAKRMRDATIKWRADTGAERSLSTPQPTMEMIRMCYPYFAHGRSKKGEVVVYERTGMMQFGKLAAAGVTPFDMQVGWLVGLV